MTRFLQRLRRRTSRLHVPVLAVLFWLGYAASFAHDVTVRHSLCADHGEWVHDATPAVGARPALCTDDGAPQVRSTPPRTDDSHEHCAIVIVARGTRWLAPSTPLAMCEPVLDGVRSEIAGATPVRECRIRPTPARGPPTCV